MSYGYPHCYGNIAITVDTPTYIPISSLSLFLWLGIHYWEVLLCFSAISSISYLYSCFPPLSPFTREDWVLHFIFLQAARLRQSSSEDTFCHQCSFFRIDGFGYYVSCCCHYLQNPILKKKGHGHGADSGCGCTLISINFNDSFKPFISLFLGLAGRRNENYQIQS